jgi:valyl-tRNA synthetase
MVSEYPKYNDRKNYFTAVKDLELVKEIIKVVRNVKVKTGAAPSKKVNLYIISNKTKAIKSGLTYVKKLAGVSEVNFISSKDELSEKYVSQVIDGAELFIPLGELVDLTKERQRLAEELRGVESEIARASGKLSNAGFLAKAPKQLVDSERDKLNKYIEMRDKLKKQIEDMN